MVYHKVTEKEVAQRRLALFPGKSLKSNSIEFFL
jgi:hypothetical protein